ncbi:glycosyltransferase [Candidatus Pelagibacter sp. HIMB1506]|uniref:glycosyltransferase family A protein n=1 Tax=Candidatus Pelagibacter sp. HIMB1506 TaxID=3413337 RepID=UPI003F8678B4
MKKDKIVICICSRNFNNNFVNLLENIFENQISYNLNIKVLIVFNNFKKIKSVEEKVIKKKLRKIKYKIFYEKKIGISYARNKILKQLKFLNFEYCCFLDDDCKIKKNFLISHLNFIKKSGSKIIGGPQLYMSKKAFFRFLERNFQNKSLVSWASTNNVFFEKSILKHKLLFSNIVSQYGFGEDQLYFYKLSKLGEKIIWNRNPTYEIKQKNRENIKWFLQRNFKYGLTGILIDTEIYGFLIAIVLNLIKLILNLFLSVYYILILPINPINNFYRSLGFFFRFLGRLFNIIKYR